MRRHVLVLLCAFWLPVLPGQAEERSPAVRTLLPGVELTLIAEHPQLATPTGIDIDEHGQIWLVATHTHFRPDDYEGPEHDEVLIFADADGDGHVEQRTVFSQSTTATMDLELGPDGWVYLAQRDRILRMRDTNGDAVADEEETLITLDTEADYPHNGLEGLAWHPDGNLLFGLGENFAKPWVLTDRDNRTFEGTGEGGIFRCTPAGRKLSRVAHGFWNPFGICVRQDGEMFAVDNDPGERPPCRLLHVVQDGDYGYQRSYGPESHHPFVAWNGELAGTLPMLHPTGEAPCGVSPAGGGLIVPSWSDHRIDFFSLSRHGASYQAQRTAIVQGGRYFRPGCLAAAPGQDPEGPQSWYLTDWVDGSYAAHGYGRLWKLTIDPAAADWWQPASDTLETAESQQQTHLRQHAASIPQEQLFQLAADRDPFVARAALLVLGRRLAAWDAAQLKQLTDTRLHLAIVALRIADQRTPIHLPDLLERSSADVQYETLRWMADGRFTELLPDVHRYMQRTDLNFRCFEAAIATLNTLQGQSEAGLRNDDVLLERVQDNDLDPRLRAFALRMLPAKELWNSAAATAEPPSVPELLSNLLHTTEPLLLRETIRCLAVRPQTAQQLLLKLARDVNQPAAIRAEAICGLAEVADAVREPLVRLAGDSHPDVRSEALRGLRGLSLSTEDQMKLRRLAQQWPDSGELITAVLDPESLTRNRPPTDDYRAWHKRLTDLPGTGRADRGRRLFHHSRLVRCSGCHRFQGRGNVVGPDLTSVSRGLTQPEILQALLQPSLKMAPEYQPRTLELLDGRSVTGIRLRSWTKEVLRDAQGQSLTFDRNEIEAIHESPVSFMPEGLATQLTWSELRDLLTFLGAAPEPTEQ